MDNITREHFNNLHSKDAESRYLSFQFLATATREPVNWFREVWDELLSLTTKGDNHQRTLAVQLLSNLAKNDPDRMLKDLDKLLAVTKDEKFVTARHSLQNLWKVGIVNQALLERVTNALSTRFRECIHEKNCTLVRFDIVEVYRKMYEKVPDDYLKIQVAGLIQSEADLKYRKKYAGLWKGLLKDVTATN